jgi:hypothetical protein
MLYVPDRCTFRTMSLRHAFGHAVSLHKTMSPNHAVFVCAPNAGLQLRRAISIQAERKGLLKSHAIAPSAARLCYVASLHDSSLWQQSSSSLASVDGPSTHFRVSDVVGNDKVMCRINHAGSKRTRSRPAPLNCIVPPTLLRYPAKPMAGGNAKMLSLDFLNFGFLVLYLRELSHRHEAKDLGCFSIRSHSLG